MAELKALIAQLARDSEAAGAVLKDKEVTEEKVAEADAATSNHVPTTSCCCPSRLPP